MEDAKWSAHGDANPIPHGGIWVRKDGEHCYQVVKVDAIEDTEGSFSVSDCTIDITDTWINKEHVTKYADTPKDDEIRYAIDIVSYYGSYHCNGTQRVFETDKFAIEELLTYGIEVS